MIQFAYAYFMHIIRGLNTQTIVDELPLIVYSEESARQSTSTKFVVRTLAVSRKVSKSLRWTWTSWAISWTWMFEHTAIPNWLTSLHFCELHFIANHLADSRLGSLFVGRSVPCSASNDLRSGAHQHIPANTRAVDSIKMLVRYTMRFIVWAS